MLFNQIPFRTDSFRLIGSGSNRDIRIPFNSRHTVKVPMHIYRDSYVPVYATDRERPNRYSLIIDTTQANTYKNAEEAFRHHYSNKSITPSSYYFRGKWYYIGPGFIFEILGRFKDTPSRYERCKNRELVLRPLILTFVTREDIKYLNACCTTRSRFPVQDVFKIFIEHGLDVKNSNWEGARYLYRKHLKEHMEGCVIKLSDLSEFMPKPKIPTFTTTQEREKTLAGITSYILKMR